MLPDFRGAGDEDFEGGESSEFGVGQGEMTFDDFGGGVLVDVGEGEREVNCFGVVAVEESLIVESDVGGGGVVSPKKLVEGDEGDIEFGGEELGEGGFAGARAAADENDHVLFKYFTRERRIIP